MECRSIRINAGSFAGIVGQRSALVAASVGRKSGINAGRVNFKCRLLQVSIDKWHLENAVHDVRAFIDAVALTLRRETDADDLLPIVHPRWSF